MAEPSFFKSRVEKYSQLRDSFNRKFQLFATFRIIIFLIGLVLAIYFANERNATALFYSILPTIILFALTVKHHNRIRYNRNHAQFKMGINQNEIQRIDGDLGDFDLGDEFIDENHNYSADLDIFGKNSLFQLINRTSTKPGRKLLASWLQSPAEKSQILARQEAVKELADQVDWRQDFQASAMHSWDDKTVYGEFDLWLEEGPQVYTNRFLRITSYLLPLLTIISIAGFFLNYWSYYISILFFVINGIVLSRTLKYAAETTEKATKSLEIINGFKSLILLAESKKFKSNFLVDIGNTLTEDGIRASTRIERLSRIMQKFAARGNMFFFLLDLLLLLDIHWLIQAESWKIRNKERVIKWIKNISSLEAISSLSGTLFTHDNFHLPQIATDDHLQLTNVGHPLISPRERVNNDFEINSHGMVVIITGSNMSGKSTFLRTVGINMVLAYAGGPVCANEASLPVMQVYSSMRTRDNLEEHISSFYAELKRIKGLLNLIRTSEIPVFYLLDEILKGTNSEDRHLGAESLVIQLLSLNGMGLISTHDIALSGIQQEYEKVRNYSFNSTINKDEIHFDYKISEGVCKGFNASKLMEKMGIELHQKKGDHH